MFASKMPDGSSGGGVIPPPVAAAPGGAFRAEPAPPRAHRDPNQDFQEPPGRERKLSETSSGPAGKSKWMSAFKSIKGKKEPADDR